MYITMSSGREIYIFKYNLYLLMNDDFYAHRYGA